MKCTGCLLVVLAVAAAGCGDDESPEKTGGGDGNGTANKTDGGSAIPGSRSVSLPKDLPADIPIYPGARAIHHATVKDGFKKRIATTIQFETTDGVQKVHAFYEKTLKEQSWQIEHSASNLTTKAVAAGVSAKKDKRLLSVSINAIPGRSAGTTRILLYYSRPDE